MDPKMDTDMDTDMDTELDNAPNYQMPKKIKPKNVEIFELRSEKYRYAKNLSSEHWFNQLPNQTDNRGRTPLHFAAKDRHFLVLKFIWKDQKKNSCKE